MHMVYEAGAGENWTSWKWLGNETNKTKYKAGTKHTSPPTFTPENYLNLLTDRGLVRPYGNIWGNIGSGNGLMPDGTKPLPKQW